MRYPGRRRRRFGLAALVAGIAASSAYAFTNSNTVPATNAGSGSGAISGYTASNVAYNLNASNPQNIDSVTFTISPAAATTVKIQLASGGSWYSCTNTSGSVSCTTTSPQATAAAATQLTVVATQ
jgi:membrane associated rhomboid family serine protease